MKPASVLKRSKKYKSAGVASRRHQRRLPRASCDPFTLLLSPPCRLASAFISRRPCFFAFPAANTNHGSFSIFESFRK